MTSESNNLEYPKVIIHKELLDESTALLQSAGDQLSAHEKVLYWAGTSSDEEWRIHICIVPQASSTWGSYNTSANANAEVIEQLGAKGLELLCQVHSHPGYLVGHSKGDDNGALMPYDSFLSIVVPVYGKEGMLPLTQCGIHRFEKTTFRRLSNLEVTRGFSIV